MNTFEGKGDILVRRASLSDVEQMHALINRFAGQGWMLAKSRHNLYQNIRDFYVAEKYIRAEKKADSNHESGADDADGARPYIRAEFAGCAALHVLWVDLGEIRSLAVEERFQKNGVGRVLIEAVLHDAAALKLPRVVALTYQRAFFERMGFVEVADKSTLPQKVWGECMDCPKFPNCDESAMVADAPFVMSGAAKMATLAIGEW
jgi:amino-acid N-acetyltransferase